MRESQTDIPPKIEPGGTNAFNFITLSQDSWRNLKRGILSRPQEIPGLSGLLDTSIKKVFSEYLDPSRPPTVVAWSVLTDEPVEPRGCRYVYRRPEGIKEADDLNYFIGISQLNEWGTDFAARYWMSHSSEHSAVRKIGKIYGDIIINIGQKIIYKQAFDLMEQIQTSASRCGQDFEHAVFKALFLHDFNDLDEVVLQTKIADIQTLDQLAVFLGKKIPNINESRLSRSLSVQKNDTDIMRLIKRITDSMLRCGCHSQPGIVELVVLQPSTVLISGIMVSSEFQYLLTGIATGTLAGLTITGLPYGYVLLHETVHDYQTDSKFCGFIPETLTSIG